METYIKIQDEIFSNLDVDLNILCTDPDKVASEVLVFMLVGLQHTGDRAYWRSSILEIEHTGDLRLNNSSY